MKQGTPDLLADMGGFTQLEGAAQALIAVPPFGLSASEVSRLLARHEPALLAQAKRGFLRQHDPPDRAPWARLRDQLQLTVSALSPEEETATRGLLRAFLRVLRAELKPEKADPAYLREEVAELYGDVVDLVPAVGDDDAWLWKLDVIELVRRLDLTHATEMGEVRAIGLSPTDAAQRDKDYERWSNILLCRDPAPRALPGLKGHMIGRFVDDGGKPVRPAPLARGVPQRSDEPRLAPILARHWGIDDTGPVQPMALDLNTLLRELTADPTWRSERPLLGQIFARLVMWLCDEVGQDWTHSLLRVAGKVLRAWHAARTPDRLDHRPTARSLESLAVALEKAGFTNQTVRAFQVGFGPFEGIADVRELVNVVRLELEINLDGGYAHDRLGVEQATLDVLAALGAVEDSAARRRSR